MERILRDRLDPLAGIIMRVPLLFIVDGLLRIRLGLPDETTAQNDINVTSTPDIQSLPLTAPEAVLTDGFSLDPNGYQMFAVIMLKFIMCCIGCIAALCTFMLWMRQLLIVYLYLISVGVIFVSYWSNVSTMKAVITYASKSEYTVSTFEDIQLLNLVSIMEKGSGFLLVQNYILQCLLVSIFCYIHFAPKYSILQNSLILSFMLPSILAIHPLPTSVLHYAPLVATLLPLGVCKFIIWRYGIAILRAIYMEYVRTRNFIRNHGLSVLVAVQWIRLRVPCVLRTFWMLRMGEQIVEILGNHYGDEDFCYYDMIKTLLANGCETLTAVLGLTSIISLICHYIGCFFQWILLTENENEKSFGTISAILFYILTLQTGLTSLDTEIRLVKLCRNICLLFIAMLHFVHNIVNPLLMSLSASHNPSVHRHLRALAVCAFLLLSPISLLAFLWSRFSVSTWLLAVSIFSVEVIVKVVVSLAIYTLFLIDAYRTAFWEELDDRVYVIRSFGNIVEFAFGIILFFNGFWVLIFESGGAMRAITMCIHAYFNIWCEVKAGWLIFMKRRIAVNKINSLAEAKFEQLRSLNDVCAICYQEMHTAKITRCNHYFHGVCLRKWLYVQDRCPLCHDSFAQANDDSSTESLTPE